LALTIPERFRDGLAAIAVLDDDSFAEVYEALKSVSVETLGQQELANTVANEVRRISAEDTRKIVDVLASLYQLRSRGIVSAEKVASDLYDALKREQSPLLKEQYAADIQNRLTELLSLESLSSVAARAKELQMDVERVFCEARILTDLRPIFGTQVGEPKAMMIIHTLKLGYHDGATGKHEELFVALDNDDIQKLKRVLERAEKKTKSLISTLQTAGIKTVDLL